MHPYPRKSVDSFKGTSVSNQPDKTPSPKALDFDNRSPTSVLSAFVSDGSGSGVSDQQNGCSSPTSCTTENEYGTFNSPRQDEKASVLPTQLSGNSTWEDSLSMVKLSFEFWLG